MESDTDNVTNKQSGLSVTDSVSHGGASLLANILGFECLGVFFYKRHLLSPALDRGPEMGAGKYQIQC